MAGTPLMAPKLEDLSYTSIYANYMIRQNIAEIQKAARDLPDNVDVSHLQPISNAFTNGKDRTTFKVGIIGAGIAGLFTAKIFDYLKERFNLDVEYTILEANQEQVPYDPDHPEQTAKGPSIGGRLYSYHFAQKDPSYPVTPHDYFDVGAMRFPDNPIMTKTFALFDELGMHRKTPPKDKVEYGDLIPYYLNAENTPLLYNGVQRIPVTKSDGSKEDITAAMFQLDGLPVDIQNEDCSKLVEVPIEVYTDCYKNYGAAAFWEKLMASGDAMSCRQWLRDNAGYDFNTIEFLEALNFGSGWYDEALSEIILSNMDFAFGPSIKWWCIEGGAQQLALKTAASLKQATRIQCGKRVTAVSFKNLQDAEKRTTVEVCVKGEESSPREFDAVFNSVPLGAMQHMQLEGLNLNWGTKQAIRSVNYGASCKVGIRFKKLWWKQAPYNITGGGVAKTDLPIRSCVYPSYNLYDDPEKPGVLLVSYTWGNEANRIGSLINNRSPENEDDLRDLILHDLARLHTDNDASYSQLKQELGELYMDHYAFNWFNHKESVGAIAFFSPGQFSNMFQYITRNDGKHIIIGEGASAHHAWVAGSLESAVRGVYQFLARHAQYDQAASDACRAYEHDQIPAPYGPIPAEFCRISDLGQPQGSQGHDQASPLGELARWQVKVEEVRLQQGGDVVVPNDSVWKKRIEPLVETKA